MIESNAHSAADGMVAHYDSTQRGQIPWLC